MNKNNKQISQYFFLLTLICMMCLGGCASTSPDISGDINTNSNLKAWMQSAIDYHDTLPIDHPDRLESTLYLPQEVSAYAQEEFSHLPANIAASKLAKWLVKDSGRALEYDVSANLSPLETFQQRKGNCLSFTILLVSIAQKMGVSLDYNQVDVPQAWESISDTEVVLYEHVNATYKAVPNKYVFDLAIQNYRFGFPQRTITETEAVARLFSNRGIEALKNQNYAAADHNLKLALGYDSNSSQIWSNYGVLLKRLERVGNAKEAFKHSLKLDPNNAIAASHMERIYRHAGQHYLADKYSFYARQARRINPYFHFKKAESLFLEGEYVAARKAIKKAQSLHHYDPQFFELGSKIALKLNRYSLAIREMKKAAKLSVLEKDRSRYVAKTRKLERIQNGQSAQISTSFVNALVKHEL